MVRFPSPKNQDRLCVPHNIQFKKKKFFILEEKLPAREAHLVTIFRMRTATHPFAHAPSRHAQGQTQMLSPKIHVFIEQSSVLLERYVE